MTNWRPLLEGRWREQALQVVREVAEAVAACGQHAALDASLANGAAGLALLFSWMDRTEPSPRYSALAEHFMEVATEAVAAQPMRSALYSGFTGVAWALQQLQRSEEEGEDGLSEMDAAVARMLQVTPWTGDFDLVSGLTGLGVYALERLPRPQAALALSRVVSRLGELVHVVPEGLAWWTRPGRLHAAQQAEFPHGRYDLGVAHGLPGVMTVLAGAAAAGIAREESLRLLRGGWSYLNAARLPGEGAHLPSYLDPGGTPVPARAAWCYGMPGVAAALHSAARALGESDWAGEVLALARAAALRPVADSGVRDAGLCHGSAGLAHLYNRLFQATGDGVFAEAARMWLEETLRQRQPGSGIGGYSAWTQPGGQEGGWVDRPGLLTGAAGVALALLAAATPVEPTWDRMLLMSLRE